ncbi:MAG: ice-binding family protein [Microgenomates group bacterium]
MKKGRVFSFGLSLVQIFIPALFFFLATPVYAATSPILVGASSYSVLGGQAVTNTGSTTTTGNVGVSSGTSLTGFPPGIAGGNNAVYLHNNDASAIAAQADNLTAFGTLDQTCDQTYGAQDLTLISPLSPGVYCSTSSFSLSGNLTLAGSGVWIFKTVSTLITSSGSSVTGGDPCNVWWRVGSSVTLGTTTSFIGNILALNGVNAMNTGATLNGRLLVQDAGTVTLDGNTISGPTCTASTTTTSSVGSSIGDNSAPNPFCPTIDLGVIAPNIIDSRRVDADSIYISWGPYSGTNDFIVRYGTTKDNLIYNVDVTGFSTTINALPANQPIWVQVAARNECQIGTFEAAVLVGGPRLPNAGTGGESNNNYWSVLVGTLLGLGIYFISRGERKRV